MTLLAPSVNATAPAAFNRPISASSLPAKPFVSAPIGSTCTIAVSRARRITKSTIAGSSITGSVSGWQTIVVTPPAAAAWLAVASVSRYSAPGSPIKARISTRPGVASLPSQSMTSVPSGTPAAWIPRLASRITPSAISRSPVKSRSRDGSTIRALASRIGRRSFNIGSRVRQVARQGFEHRHAHCDAHLDLLADQRLRAVRNRAVDLDAAVHRPRMHHQRVRLGVAELLLIETVIVEVLLRRGDEGAV